MIPDWLHGLLTLPIFLAGGVGTTALGFVGAKFHKLDSEVKECRARDSRFVIIEAGFRMVVGELGRIVPDNAVLAQTGDLLNQAFGDKTPQPSDFNDLIAKLCDQEATHEPRR